MRGGCDDLRLRFHHGLEPGEDIGQRAEGLFLLPIHQLDGARIESCPGELTEVTPLRLAILRELDLRQIDQRLPSLLDDSPCRVEVHGQPELACEDIDCAERQHAEARPAQALRFINNAVDDLVHRAVAARRDDDLESLPHRFRRERTSAARRVSRLERDARRERCELIAKLFRFLAACSGIEDDTGFHVD